MKVNRQVILDAPEFIPIPVKFQRRNIELIIKLWEEEKGMVSNQTLEEEFKDHKKKALDNFWAINTEITWLTEKWDAYRLLFQTPSGSKALLNASELAYIILLDVFIESIVLTISRLTDPKTTRLRSIEKANSTISRLIDDFTELFSEKFDGINYQYLISENDIHIEIDNERTQSRQNQDKLLLIEINRLNEELNTLRQPIKDVRNTIKAHRNLDDVLKQQTENSGIPIVDNRLKYEDIDQCIQLIKNIFNKCALCT